MVGVRYPVTANICCRVTASLTGRRSACEAMIATIRWGRGVPLEPNPPPTWGEITRTRSGSSPNTRATVFLTLTTP